MAYFLGTTPDYAVSPKICHRTSGNCWSNFIWQVWHPSCHPTNSVQATKARDNNFSVSVNAKLQLYISAAHILVATVFTGWSVCDST